MLLISEKKLKNHQFPPIPENPTFNCQLIWVLFALLYAAFGLELHERTIPKIWMRFAPRYTAQFSLSQVPLKSGADINKADESGLTPIRYALAGGQGNAAKFLLDQGADINITPYQLNRIISEAAKAGLIDIVRILIEEVFPASGFGSNALHQAVQGNHIDVVKLLIEKRADINATNIIGLTPLDIAKQNGQIEIVELLKQNGAKESPPSLTEIVRSNDIEELNRLISRGADMNVTSTNGSTPLHYAVQFGHKDIVELLIAKGADLNA